MLKLAPVTCEYSIIPEILRTQRQRWRPRRAHTHTRTVHWFPDLKYGLKKRETTMNDESRTLDYDFEDSES